MTPLKLALAAGAAALALPFAAHAQMNMNMPGMNMSGMKMPMPKKKAPAQKKAAAKKSTAKEAATRKTPAARTSPARAAKKPSAKKGTPTPAPHNMSSMPGMAMPGNSDAERAGTNLPAGNAPAPPVPSDHAADHIYGPDAMAMGRHHFQTSHGGQKIGQVMVNLLEYQAKRGRDGYEWNGEAWYGGDIDRLWIKSEGDGTFGRSVEKAEAQALYSHAIDPYFNLQAGARYDFKPDPSRAYATVGIEGLAPSFFEVEGALFLSNKGEVMARGEAWYDQRITQRLILQPRVELNLAAQNSRSIGVGAGLSDAELGFRLRYDIRREFSPYVGVQYRRAFGRTRTYLNRAGEDAGGWEFLAGLRTWF